MKGDLYARKSTADAGRSAARQERDWRADCDREGIEPGRVFVDPDLSASRYARRERPDYENLLAHIRSSECEMVCMWEASRGSRQLGEWIAFLELCRGTGTLIRIFTDGGRTYDVRRRRDWRSLAEEGLDAHDESVKLSERVRAGTRDAAANGKPPGPLLYGYSRVYDERGRFVEQIIHPDRAAIVRRAAVDTLAGIPLHAQARALNERSVPTPSGEGHWIGGHINRMLRNPGYIGHRVYLGEVVAKNAWPAILTDDEHEQLVALLAAPGRRNHANSALAYQLSGAAVCGACERVLRSGVNRTRYVCAWAGCQRVSAPIKAMDDFVNEVIIERLRRPDAAAVFAPQSDDAAVKAARKELRELQDHLDGFYAQAAQRKLSAEGLAKVEAQIKPEIAALERGIQKLVTPPALRALEGVDVAGTWSTLPVGTRREVIIALAEIRLAPVGKGGRWSPWRLAGSRWHGDSKTWGEIWGAA